MIKKVFTVYDEKSEAYMQPFYFDTIGQAIRAITDCCNDIEHNFCRHSADFTLFQVAEFNDQTGEFSAMKKPLGSLVEFKIQREAFSPEQLSLVGGTE